MQFGVCCGPDVAVIAKQAGFDYFEWSVGSLLHPGEDERVFENALTQARAVGLPFPSLNVFVPADLKITGPVVDFGALEQFINTALRRAERAGIEVISLGSGGARSYPEGLSKDRAMDKLAAFVEMLAPVAQRYGVVVAVEPLNKTETNLINTVAEGAALVREVNHPNLRLLVDGYHWGKANDTLESIIENVDLLAHAHVATVEGRRPPHPDDDCAPFFAALKQAGYDGRISFEGNLRDPASELPVALEIIRRHYA